MTTVLSNKIQEVENLETFNLIWLNNSLNNSKENTEIHEQLRPVINYFLTFEDEEKCLQYIYSLSNDDRIVLILNGNFIQQTIPKIIHLRQITSIYIFSNDKNPNEQWMQNFNKVKGVFIHLDELIQQIHEDQAEREMHNLDESISISVFNSKKTNEKRVSNANFIRSQMLIDCINRLEPSSNDKNDLIALCKEQYKNNPNELNIVKEFEKDYSSRRSLWWYTRHSFLSRLLNKAFRVQNIDLLLLFRFFIRDIRRELKKNKCSSSVRAYRAQLMSKEELIILTKSVGEFISINSFLSTSPNREETRSLLTSSTSSDDIQQVFFEINTERRLGNTNIFSHITSHSYFPDREEFLFTIGSIFRLVHIDHDNDGVWNIQLVLCSYKDHQFQSLVQHMKNELSTGEKDILEFGFVLEDVGKLDDAEKYFHRVLNQLPNHHDDVARCYYALGEVTQNKGDYDSSLEWYHKSLEIDIRRLKLDSPDIATTHNNIAVVYSKKGDYTRALESYELALEIWKKKLGEDHLDVAMCYNNMGIIYQEEKKYSEALGLYHTALSIRQKSLPAEHLCLGQSYACIGNVHYHLDHFDLALEHYNLSLNIFKKSLSSHHLEIAMILRNIGLAYQGKNEFKQALVYMKKAVAFYRHSSPSTHPDVIQIEQIMRRISSKL